MTRKLSLVLGILLAVGAFVGVLLLGSVVNPSPYHVLVAVTDVQPGTILSEDLVGVDAQMVSPQVAAEYILSGELDRYLGATIVRSLVPGQPLMHRDLVDADNPAAYRHLALALEDPNLVAMVIPVEEDNTPDGIVPGDQIAIVWSVGEASFMAAPVSSSGSSGESTGIPEEGAEFPGSEDLPPELAERLGGVTASSTPEVVPPLAKTVINTAQVIRVRREQEANPAYTGQEGESPYIEGRIQALEVAVVREEMEPIQFAVANGEYSIVVLSPNVDPREAADAASLGVMWQDVLDYFQADRLRALGVLTVTEPIRPSGAANIYGPLLAPAPPGSSSRGGTPVADVPPTSPTPPEEQGEEIAEVTATPVPLPTATPVPVAEAGPGEPEAPAPSSSEEGPSGSSSLPASTGNLLAGVGCTVVVITIIGLGVLVAMRALRKRGRVQA